MAVHGVLETRPTFEGWTLINGSGILDRGAGNFSDFAYETVTVTDSNVTTPSVTAREATPLYHHLNYIYVTVTVFYAVVFLVGVAGNVLVPVVVARNKELRTPTSYFLVNLCVADLLVLCVCMPVALLEFHARDIWYLGTAMCKIVPYLENVVAHASVLTILAISFEKYGATCRPLESLYRCTTKRALKMISSVWGTSLVATIPFVTFPYVDEAIFHDGRIVQVCRTPVDTAWKQAYVIATIVVFFLVPLCVLAVTLRFIARALKKKGTGMESLLSGRSQQQASLAAKTKRQVINALLAITVIFFVCLMPMRVITLWYIYSSEEQKVALGLEGYLNLISFSRIMLYGNSAVNPVIYNIIYVKFRHAVLCSLKLRRRRASSLPLVIYTPTCRAQLSRGSQDSRQSLRVNGRNSIGSFL